MYNNVPVHIFMPYDSDVSRMDSLIMYLVYK